MKPVRKDLLDRIARIRLSDPKVMEEINKRWETKEHPTWAREVTTAMGTLMRDTRAVKQVQELALTGDLDGDLAYESIALRLGRPVYEIRDGKPVVPNNNDGSTVWSERFNHPDAGKLHAAIASVGRINMVGQPQGMPYAGTGWFIDTNVIVTNRHVAKVFAEARGTNFVLKAGFDRKSPIQVSVNPLEEIANQGSHSFKLVDVIYIAGDSDADVAFLRVETLDGHTPLPAINLFSGKLTYPSMAAVVGYPGDDPNIPDQKLMQSIFGGVFGKKRIAPGFVNNTKTQGLAHDCTTLGGNSGSPVLDMATGEACALHFAGIFLKENYAVPITRVAELWQRAKYPGSSSRRPAASRSREEEQLGALAATSTAHPQPIARTTVQGVTMPAKSNGSGGTEIRLTIPVEVVLRIGEVKVQSSSAGEANPSFAEVDSSQTNAKAAARVDPADTRLPSSTTTSLVIDDAKLPGTMDKAIVEAQQLLGQRKDVVRIEPGWRFVNGWITDERAIVVSVRKKLTNDELESQGVSPLPGSVMGVPVDVRTAPLVDKLGHAIETDLITEAPWKSDYKTMPDVPLKMIDGRMSVVFHTSPDSGWANLSKFLSETQRSLTIGMYDFTAPHIVEAVSDAASPDGRTLSLVLQRGEDIGKGTKKDDLTDADTVQRLSDSVGGRFEFAWASVKSAGALFQTSYHIKVAVRDSKAFWLSSGNWQSSNQPPADPINDADTRPSLLSTCNREWHAIVENEELSTIFEKYLLRDREQAAERGGEESIAETEALVWVPEDAFQPTETELEAPPRYFPPLIKKNVHWKVQPLLTPDNYPDEVLKLIESAKQRVLFQNQSFTMKPQGQNPDKYERLLLALLQKQRDGLDVRIIFRKIGDVRTNVSNAVSFGFDPNFIRLQTNCHTKGLIVDERAVLVSSQNWTGAGTTTNRDAGLIFFEREAVNFFAELFEYDWERIGRPRINENLPPAVLATDEESVRPANMVLMPLSKWLGEE